VRASVAASPGAVFRRLGAQLAIPTLVYYPRFLPQRDLCLGPAMASRPVGRDGCFEVVYTGDVLDDRHATIVPDIDPKGGSESSCSCRVPATGESLHRPVRCETEREQVGIVIRSQGRLYRPHAPEYASPAA
jgi:hypothetical protein